MGAWSFVQPRIATATRHLNGREQRPLFFGRKPSAATATVTRRRRIFPCGCDWIIVVK